MAGTSAGARASKGWMHCPKTCVIVLGLWVFLGRPAGEPRPEPPPARSAHSWSPESRTVRFELVLPEEVAEEIRSPQVSSKRRGRWELKEDTLVLTVELEAEEEGWGQ